MCFYEYSKGEAIKGAEVLWPSTFFPQVSKKEGKKGREYECAESILKNSDYK